MSFLRYRRAKATDRGKLGDRAQEAVVSLARSPHARISCRAPGGRGLHADRRNTGGRRLGWYRDLVDWFAVDVRVAPSRSICARKIQTVGPHSESTEIGEPGTPGSVIHQNYHSYQLNLVLDDPKEPRYNLTTHSDWKWMRETGQTLADFLGIPVADQLYHSA